MRQTALGPLKLLLVDDHQVIREALAALLMQLPDVAVLEAGDSAQGLKMVAEDHTFDAVLLDIMGVNGLAAIPEFGRCRPDLPVIVLSASEDPQHVRTALESGALGYVPKSAGRQTLLAALQLVLSGTPYVPTFAVVGGSSDRPAVDKSEVNVGLTKRESEILKLMGSGLPNKLIAYELRLTEQTVKGYITNIFKALSRNENPVGNRIQAVNTARKLGLIS
jgi:two-component system, NarL family, nitrate/nitrite response regulator NarL